MTLVDRVERVFQTMVETRVVAGAEPATIVLAISGGLDSMVLLDLFLRFRHLVGCTPVVAHYDHGMRPGSEDDAKWLRGICQGHGVSMEQERSAPGLSGEADARKARWDYLERVADRIGAIRIATAHHADDQAETVLFRIARGTGIDGLAGMSIDTGRILRPLLPLFREDLEAFAAERGISWREDPTNQDLTYARNRLRHEVIPLLERHVAPGTRQSLVRLAEHASQTRQGRQDAFDCIEVVGAHAVVIGRDRFTHYDRAAQARTVRAALRTFGVVVSSTGTRAVIEFIIDTSSGKELHLPNGVRLFSEPEGVRFERVKEAVRDIPFRFFLPEAGGGTAGAARLGGRIWSVSVERAGSSDRGERSVRIPLDVGPGPLEVRAWEPGDRIALRGGTRKLKELWRELRVPRGERSTIPVLVDAEGGVLWIAGGPRSAHLERTDGAYFTLVLDE